MMSSSGAEDQGAEGERANRSGTPAPVLTPAATPDPGGQAGVGQVAPGAAAGDGGGQGGCAGGDGSRHPGLVHVIPDNVLGGLSTGGSSYREVVENLFLADTDDARRDIWHKEVQRGCLAAFDQGRLVATDRVVQPRDRSTAGERAAWYARIRELPAAIPLDPTKKDLRVSASVLRCPEEASYMRRAMSVWDGLLKTGRGGLPVPGPRYVAMKPPFLLQSFTRAHSTRFQSERRARVKGMIISHNHQEFWKQDEAARMCYYPQVAPDTYRVEPPKGFASAAVPFAWYFLDALLHASGQNRWDSIPYAMMRSEQAVLAAAYWYQDCRNRAVFWILPEMLVWHLRDQLTTSFLASGFEEGKAFLDDMIRFRLLMPVLDGSFQREVRAQKPKRGDGGGRVSDRFHSSPPYNIQLQTALSDNLQLGGSLPLAGCTPSGGVGRPDRLGSPVRPWRSGGSSGAGFSANPEYHSGSYGTTGTSPCPHRPDAAGAGCWSYLPGYPESSGRGSTHSAGSITCGRSWGDTSFWCGSLFRSPAVHGVERPLGPTGVDSPLVSLPGGGLVPGSVPC